MREAAVQRQVHHGVPHPPAPPAACTRHHLRHAAAIPAPQGALHLPLIAAFLLCNTVFHCDQSVIVATCELSIQQSSSPSSSDMSSFEMAMTKWTFYCSCISVYPKLQMDLICSFDPVWTTSAMGRSTLGRGAIRGSCGVLS